MPMLSRLYPSAAALGVRGVCQNFSASAWPDSCPRLSSGVECSLRESGVALLKVLPAAMDSLRLEDGPTTFVLTRVPLTLLSARGSMLLRRFAPPRGMIELSTAYGASSTHSFLASQLYQVRTGPFG